MSITISFIIYCLQISILIFSLITFFKLRKLVNKTESIDLLIDNSNQDIKDHFEGRFTDMFEPLDDEVMRNARKEYPKLKKIEHHKKPTDPSLAMKNYHKRKQLVEEAILLKKNRDEFTSMALKKFNNDYHWVKKAIDLYDRETR